MFARTFFDRVFAFVSRLVAGRAGRELRGMSDQELKDLAIGRSQIPYFLHAPAQTE